jgi:hypothetical protein
LLPPVLAIDSLLQLAHREGATELRVGTDRSPTMIGSRRQLSMPPTPDDMLRHSSGACSPRRTKRASSGARPSS